MFLSPPILCMVEGVLCEVALERHTVKNLFPAGISLCVHALHDG